MTPNVLQALSNILKYQVTDLSAYSTTYEIGINSEGERLEYYIKDCIASTLHIKGKEKKEDKYTEVFAWLGNQNNPPDLIIRGGDAFEIKKTKTLSPTIPLNSSPPKDMLRSSDTRLVAACKECDGGNWVEKDIFYVMGTVKDHKLSHLFFVHGECYAASHDVYSRLSETITEGVTSLDLEFYPTNELGRVNRVDPLGITDLRIRGQWQIKHPINVFSQHYTPRKGGFGLAAIMLKSKYDSYPIEDRKEIEASKELSIKHVKIRDPNNPANRIDSVVLSNSPLTSLNQVFYSRSQVNWRNRHMSYKPKTLDLFCGCGGLSLGFEYAGYEVKVANDIWGIALETYKHNFPNANPIHGDISKPEIKEQIIEACGKDIDVVVGGPPCQAYSLAGSRDPEDPRGKLFNNYVEIVEELQPKAFVVENVKGILSMKHFRPSTPSKVKEEYLEVIKDRKSRNLKVSIEQLNNQIEDYLVPVPELICETFREIGYDVHYKLHNSAEFGVPQQRLRVFFIGTNTGKKIKFPRKTHSNKPSLDLKPYVNLKEAIGDLPFPEIGENDEVQMGSFSPIYMSRNRRRTWDEVSFTIQAGARHAPLHPASPPMTKVGVDEQVFGEGPQRRLSVREIARIQTFPDDFEFYGSTIQKYKQIGNAVPARLAMHIGEAVKNLL